MLRRYRATVAVIVALVVGISLGVAFVEGPTYRATADILVVPNTVVAAPSAPRPTDPVRVLNAEIRLLEGPVVRAEVERTLGSTPPISASARGDAYIIRIKAASHNPARAALIANAYASAYLEVRMATANAAAIATSRPIQNKITELQTQIELATGQRRTGLIKTQAAFEKELSQLQLDGAVHNAQTRLLSAASPPASPIHPRRGAIVAWALGVGLALGCGAGFYRDYLDDSITSPDDLSAGWPHLPVWGVIPSATRPRSGGPPMASVYQARSPAGEAYHSLCHVIRSLGLDVGGGILQVTSPSRGDGKTTTVANLGVILAQQGRRVAIVGCDLRRPQLEGVLGLDNGIGFTSVITGQVRLRDVVRRVPGQPMLVVLTAGPVPPNPAELLATDRAAQVLRSLTGAVDVVLLDCPPVLGVTDSVVVSAYADATLLVCRAGATTHHHLRQAVESLRLGGTSIAGLVLNGETAAGRDAPSPLRDAPWRPRRALPQT